MRRFLQLCILLLGGCVFIAQTPTQEVPGRSGDDVTVSVTVVDLLTQLPLEGARVFVQGWEIMGLTDAVGRVVLRGNIHATRLQVKAEMSGYMAASELRLSWLQSQDVQIALPPLHRLEEADRQIRDPLTLDPHRTQERVGDLPPPPTTLPKPPNTGPLFAGLTYPVPKNIQVKMNDGKIVTMELEEYLKGVLPKEIGTSFPAEAQRAQAVAARTYTVEYTQGGKKAICITTQCQVWGSTKYASTSKAVDDTKGQVAVYVGSNATYKGKLAGGYFAASCGGSTINVEQKWSYRPFLRARPCVENKGSACSVVCSPSTCGGGRCSSSHSTCWGIYGHRIGLCQRGAQSMAKCGKSYVQIIKHYYTDTEIANLSAPQPDPKNDAKLVGESQTPSGDLNPKQKFTKRWRLENTGNTTWSGSKGYVLSRISGSSLGGPNQIAVGSSNIAPKQQKEFSADFVASDQPGKYTSSWQMVENGKKFGPVVTLSITVKSAAPNCVDNDKDGFFAKKDGCPEPYDCDDNDKTVFPKAREICGNGKDDDCKDGDAKCPANCVDNDKDGYFAKKDGCPEPYDCDDNDKSVFPGAREICGNGKDDDCQGGDLTCSSHCVDQDKDGYFVKADGCQGPYDCDDNNKDIHPGAQEVCGNKVDEDCQGGDLPCSGNKGNPKKNLGELGCKVNSECASNFCVSYRKETICSQKCGDNQPACPKYYVCFQNTACWPEPGYQLPLKGCEKDSDCNAGGVCLNNRCAEGVQPGGAGCGCHASSTQHTHGWLIWLLLLGLLGLQRWSGAVLRRLVGALS